MKETRVFKLDLLLPSKKEKREQQQNNASNFCYIQKPKHHKIFPLLVQALCVSYLWRLHACDFRPPKRDA